MKGVANHRRIELLGLIEKSSVNPSVLELSRRAGINLKTASEHIRRLALSGLIYKHSDGTSVRHSLTPTGWTILKFLRTLE